MRWLPDGDASRNSQSIWAKSTGHHEKACVKSCENIVDVKKNN